MENDFIGSLGALPRAAPAPPPAAAPTEDDGAVVSVVDAKGQGFTVPASSLPAALAHGFKVETPEEGVARRERAADEATYGGALGGAFATSAGLLRGATLGASDVAAIRLGGDEMREHLAKSKAAHPYLSTGGEVVGAVAPALVGDEAGLAGLARVTPAGLAARAGRATEGLASGLVSAEGKGLAGRMLARGVQVGAQGAVEGALLGAGSQISEDALLDHESTADHLLAAAGHGALLGGLTGGALGAGGEALSSGLAAAARGGSELLSSAVGRKEGESLAAFLDRTSGERTWAAAGPVKSQTKSADAFYKGGSAQLGRDIRDELPELLGRETKSVAGLTRDDLALAAERGAEKHGQRLGALVDELDAKAAATGQRVRTADVLSDAQAIASELRQTPGKGGIAARIEAFADDIKRVSGLDAAEETMIQARARSNLAASRGDFRGASIAGKEAQAAERALAEHTVSFRQLRDFRRAADDLWAGAKANPELWGAKAQFHALRGSFETRLEGAAERIAGPEWNAAYSDAKRGFQRAKYLGDATKSGLAADGTNRVFSLTDNILGSGGAQVGAALGSVLGPMGAAAGAAAGGGLASVANKVLVRKHGDLLGAEVLRRASLLGGLRRNNAAVEEQIGGAVRKFFAAPRATGAASAAGEKMLDRKQVDAAIGRVRELERNPGMAHAAIEARTGPDLGREAPKTAALAAATGQRALAFLASKAPQGIGSRSDLAPGPRRFTDAERAGFAPYLRAYERPLQSVVRDLEKGRVTPQAAEFLRAVHPSTFRQVQRAVQQQVQRLEERGKPLDYQKKVRLSFLLNATTDDTLDPRFIATVQEAIATAPATAPPASNAPPARPLKSQAGDYATAVDRLERA